MNTRILALAFLAVGLSATITARADDEPPPPRDPRGVVTVVSENDLYAVHNRDRHYSNGLRIGWLSADDDVPAWAKKAGDELPFLDPDARRRIGWAVGHNVYTPEDKRRTDLIRNDRPYAAWLYVGLALQSESQSRLDTLELDVGVVGPAAYGEPIQNHWHRLIGSKSAHGWDNQIRNEPGIAVVGERKWRNVLEGKVGSLEMDMLPHVAGSLGNVFTYAGGGATFRLGENLAADFGPPRIRPALPGSASFRPEDPFGWYVFAGGEGRLVVRDISLDGNTFADSHSVDKKPVVADFQLGFALIFDRARLSYAQVMRTREFDGQRHPDFFGSLSLSTRF